MKTMRDGYGMGMFTIPFSDKKGYGHSGEIDAFTSIVTYFPQDKMAIAYTSSGARYSTDDVWIGALSIYFNRPFTIPQFNDSKTITLNTADLDKYVGKYSSTQMPLKFAITKKNTTLFVQTPGQGAIPLAVPLDAQVDNKFVYGVAGATFQFEPAKKTFTLTKGGTNYLFTKTD
jgi:hypothetical protein